MILMPIFLVALLIIFLIAYANYDPITNTTYKGEVMTFTHESGKITQYKGSCTVWHELPTFTRCGTGTESWLSQVWEYTKHYGDGYPNKHKIDGQANNR